MSDERTDFSGSDLIAPEADMTSPANGVREPIQAEENMTPADFSSRSRVWYGLGQTFDEPVTPHAALARSKLDFEVEKRDLFLANGQRLQDNMAVVRADGVPLGVVGRRYEPLQNADLADFVTRVLGGTNAVIESVGAVGNGERVWFLARLPELDEVLPGDPVSRFLLLTSSHDGSGCITAAFTPIRVRCRNLLTLALRNSERVVRIRHTRGARLALANAEIILGAGTEYFGRARDFYRNLAKTPVTTGDATRFLEELIPARKTETGERIITTQAERARATVARLIAGDGLIGFDPGSPTTRWTMWNAVTQYIDTARPVRAGTNRLEASLFNEGAGADLRSRAVELLSAPSLS